jgi:hypothetical protein
MLGYVMTLNCEHVAGSGSNRVKQLIPIACRTGAGDRRWFAVSEAGPMVGASMA